ncbi:MAG: nucleotidyl transferase AbiEii/AbiGii toxin family protein [Deltaproteobacteria bacterium]|nr:nucleotidyl transferase AbiEii/AbiGii toxin family protein [Deltaproteobacteria bacterium]
MTRRPSNIAASVRQQLLNMIRESGEDPNLIWTRYAIERLLYRLSVSSHARNFVLKGAQLFLVWTGHLYRPTIDLDLLGRGESSSEYITELFREVCSIQVEFDGLVFDPESVKVASIREDQEYQGQRVALMASLGKARIPVQVDIGFGDVVTPKSEVVTYPTLLDSPPLRVLACPRETVVAEKFQAMVMLGIANSRMKDFYDQYVMARDFTFDGRTLAQAIRATFKRRKTDIPIEPPLSLTDEFGNDEVKLVQWKAFIRKSGLEGDVPELPEVLSVLRKFLLLPMRAASGRGSIPEKWAKGGPWS